MKTDGALVPGELVRAYFAWAIGSEWWVGLYLGRLESTHSYFRRQETVVVEIVLTSDGRHDNYIVGTWKRV